MRIRTLLCVAAAALTGLTACTSDPDHAASRYDLAQVDSGNYPTVPRDAETARTEYTGAMLEAARLGAALPLAADIDGKFAFRPTVYVDRRITPVKVPPDVSTFADLAEFTELTEGLVAGWNTRGQRRERPGVGSALEMFALRFESQAAAQTAGRRLAERLHSRTPGDPVAVPGLGDATATWSVSNRQLNAQLAREGMLLLVRVEDPVTEPPDSAPQAALAGRAFTEMLNGLNRYTPTPVDQFATLPVDAEQMLRRTLPLEDATQFTRGTDPSMVLTRQAWLHSSHFPTRAKAAYADAGVDLVAVSGATLYRTADAAAAERLVAALADEDSAHYAPMDSPPHMPGVRCHDRKDPKDSATRYPPICYLGYDRFVAVLTGDNQQHVYQQTAAQYKILAAS
ncbi:DUF7373 family lipoprotein [Nocardia farcinica]|uniref:DUF7373 family lipoprotein n=1 Tax=Nocardia farcinica TaxID=37329 RepID=UPI002457BD7E|nr:hypothetical protein [Nocardia farcinica]